MRRCSQPSIRSEPSLVGMRSEAGGGPGLRTSPKQRATQKLRPVLPGHPGMLCWAGKVRRVTKRSYRRSEKKGEMSGKCMTYSSISIKTFYRTVEWLLCDNGQAIRFLRPSWETWHLSPDAEEKAALEPVCPSWGDNGKRQQKWSQWASSYIAQMP